VKVKDFINKIKEIYKEIKVVLKKSQEIKDIWVKIERRQKDIK